MMQTEPETLNLSGATSEDLARRVAMRDLRQRWEPVGDARPRYARECLVDFSPGIERMQRRCRVRQRIGELKARVRALGWQQQLALEAERRGPGYTWRGWWYPRWLVLGPLWLAIAVLFGALVVGLFRLFGGAA